MRLFQRTGLAAFAVVCLALALAAPASAGVILMDFGINMGSADGWDAIERLLQDVPYPLTDQSGAGDDDVTITALDDGILISFHCRYRMSSPMGVSGTIFLL